MSEAKAYEVIKQGTIKLNANDSKALCKEHGIKGYVNQARQTVKNGCAVINAVEGKLSVLNPTEEDTDTMRNDKLIKKGEARIVQSIVQKDTAEGSTRSAGKVMYDQMVKNIDAAVKKGITPAQMESYMTKAWNYAISAVEA